MPKTTTRLTRRVSKPPVMDIQELTNTGQGKRKRQPSRKAFEAISVNVVQAATPPSSAVDLSSADERAASGTKTTISSGRARDPLYREELLRHGINVDPMGNCIPVDVHHHANQILRMSRNSPGPSNQEMRIFSVTIEGLINEPEATLQHRLLNTPCFPKIENYLTPDNEYQLKEYIDVLFKSTAVPYNPVARLPLPNPKPDVFYGYACDAMSKLHLPNGVYFTDFLQEFGLEHYAQPTSVESYWPYLVVEFKSTKGSEWVGENQNAGAGASCVNGVDTLLRMAYPAAKRRAIDSMVFSCVINATRATLWVHYTMDKAGVVQHGYSYFDDFNLKRPDQAIAFRNSLKNIMDWALNERLTTIRKACAHLGSRDVSNDNTGSVAAIPANDIKEQRLTVKENVVHDTLGDEKRLLEATAVAPVAENTVSPWTRRLEKFLRDCVGSIV